MADSLDLCAHHYAAALEVFAQPTHPVEWAMVQANLATALRERAALLLAAPTLPPSSEELGGGSGGGSSGSLREQQSVLRQEGVACLEAAIAHYESALEVFTEANAGEVWSVLQNHLAACYADRTVRSRFGF
jgi:hypothetical protein